MSFNASHIQIPGYHIFQFRISYSIIVKKRRPLKSNFSSLFFGEKDNYREIWKGHDDTIVYEIST